MENITPSSAYILLLDLLNISDSDDYKKVADLLEKYPTKNLACFHRHAIIFYAYHDLLNGSMQIEDFLAVGDVTSKRKIQDYTNDLSSIAWVS